MLAAALGAASLAARVYTDLLWFAEVGQARVYWAALAWKVVPTAVFGLGTTCVLLANVALISGASGGERSTRSARSPAVC